MKCIEMSRRTALEANAVIRAMSNAFASPEHTAPATRKDSEQASVSGVSQFACDADLYDVSRGQGNATDKRGNRWKLCFDAVKVIF